MRILKLLVWSLALLLSVTVVLLGCDGDKGANPGGGGGGGSGGGGGGGNNKCGVDGTAGSCKTKTMPDGKTWMTENLNKTTDASWCYNNSADSCNKYGRLYTWNAANTACPSGWHLPTHEEWGALAVAAGGIGEYGGNGPAGTKLKSKSGWKWDSYYNRNGNGTDDYGFSAMPGGYGLSGLGVSFRSVGETGYWWTSSEYDTYTAWHRSIDYDDIIVFYNNTDKKIELFSVRCIKE